MENWCWLCTQLFESTEEHYGNENNKCYNRMMEREQENIKICSKCENPIDSYQTFNCLHLICKECLENHILENDVIRLYFGAKINCPIEGCNIITRFTTQNFIQLIKGSSNNNIIKKFKTKIYIYNIYSIIKLYFFDEFFNNQFEKNPFVIVTDKIWKFFEKKYRNCKCYIILEIMEYFLFSVCLFLLFFLIPINIIIIIKKFYYKFLKETMKEYKKLTIIVFIGEEILFLPLLIPFIGLHEIMTLFLLLYALNCLLIFGIIELIDLCSEKKN